MFKYLFAKNEDIPAGSAAIFFGFSSIVWFVIGTGSGVVQCGQARISGFCDRKYLFCLWSYASSARDGRYFRLDLDGFRHGDDVHHAGAG